MEENIKNKKDFIVYFKNNKKKIITIIIIIFVLLGFYSWKQSNVLLKKTQLSEYYVNAKILLETKNNNLDSLKILEQIINEKDETYSVLSLYLIIDRDLEKNEKVVLKYFDKVLSIKNLKNEDNDLIKLKKAIFISNKSSEKELLDLLNPIINSESVWKTQAILFLGDFYYSKKEFNKADQYYSKLLEIDDLNINKNEIKNKITNKK